MKHPRSGTMNTPRETWVKIAILRYQGYIQDEIAPEIGVSKSTVGNILKKLEYQELEKKIWDRLDEQQLEIHFIVQQHAKNIEASTPASAVASEHVEVDTQM